MVVVAFVTLLQNPVLGSPSWLPLLAVCWAAAFVVTMVLQASLPLPDIQRCVQLLSKGCSVDPAAVGQQYRRCSCAHLTAHMRGIPCLAAFSVWVCPAVTACRFRRLYPDSSIQVEAERLEAVQASLLGVFASHALLMAFALKLKMGAALRQPDRAGRQPGEAGGPGPAHAVWLWLASCWQWPHRRSGNHGEG